MNQETPMNNEFESTYALVVRSEDVGRSRLETLVYALLVLCAVLSIWQFAQQSVGLSTGKVAAKPSELIQANRS